LKEGRGLVEFDPYYLSVQERNGELCIRYGMPLYSEKNVKYDDDEALNISF